jgi:hypothetical protein
MDGMLQNAEEVVRLRRELAESLGLDAATKIFGAKK